jgi:hypothetical protein
VCEGKVSERSASPFGADKACQSQAALAERARIASGLIHRRSTLMKGAKPLWIQKAVREVGPLGVTDGCPWPCRLPPATQRTADAMANFLDVVEVTAAEANS